MEVSRIQHFLGWASERNSEVLLALGRLETITLQKRLSQISVERPIYICGLARSGTTILLELLSEYPKVGSFRYRDFPLVMLPFWWDKFLQWNNKGDVVPIERSHKDGIYVTPRSPEAMEEILWMSFFKDTHNPFVCNVLDHNHASLEFDAFYMETILKLLLTRGASRYLAKNNYNVTRLDYLRNLFPDVLFLILVRNPIWHIASLIKQHQLISLEESIDKRFLEYMRRSGHFEFGLDRRPINFGEDSVVKEIQCLWDKKMEVEGWAKYWKNVYSYLIDLLEKEHEIACSVRVIDYDNLCENPVENIQRICQFLDFKVSNDYIYRQSKRLRLPSYYEPKFSADDVRLINKETDDVYVRMINFCQSHD